MEDAEPAPSSTLATAAAWLARADALIVVSGAGVADQAGLVDIISSRLFETEPDLAWGQWLRASARSRERSRCQIIPVWAERMPLGSFSVTAHADGMHAMPGWPDEAFFKARDAQLFCPECCDEWCLPDWPPALEVDPGTGRIVGKRPVCPECGAEARPYLDFRLQQLYGAQGHWHDFRAWKARLGQVSVSRSPEDEGALAVILELDCGLGSPLRAEVESILASLGDHGHLIRIGTCSPGVQNALQGRALSVPISVSDALRRISKIEASRPPMNLICVTDGLISGGAAEVSVAVDACAAHAYRKVVQALNGKVWPAEPGASLQFEVCHVHQTSNKEFLKPSDSVPGHFLFKREVASGSEPRVALLRLYGVVMEGQNEQIMERIRRVESLLGDMNSEFAAAAYQAKLAEAKECAAIREMIKEVHLTTLQRHNFPVEGADASRLFQLVLQMQGFLQSGYLTPELQKAGQDSLTLSGQAKIMALTEAKRQAKLSALRISRRSNTCIVLLRHGQREDYIALEEGWGEHWVTQNERPWDPRLSNLGRHQATAAARRLAEELKRHGLPQPAHVYTSPLQRCVETADVVAQEFKVSKLLVEEGLTEAFCEAWMRQWAVPGANANWGGPPHAAMAKEATHLYKPEIQGEAVSGVRWEANAGARAVLRSAERIANESGTLTRVAANHESKVSVRNQDLRWGAFEVKESVTTRVVATVRARVEEHPGKTLVFVSHYGPTLFAFEELVGQQVPKGSGGMAALSILRQQLATPEPNGKQLWRPLLANDATHVELVDAALDGAAALKGLKGRRR